MKTSAIKGMIIPMFLTWLCLIFLVPNNSMAQNKPEKNVKKVRTERAVRADHVKKATKFTEDQKTKIKDLRIDHMKAIQLLKAESEELNAHLKTLNLAEKPNNKAIFKTIDEMMEKRAEIMKRMVSFKQAFKAILTPEQIKALEARHFNNRSGKGGNNQNFRHHGERNFDSEQMMQGDRMNRQRQMMQQEQMRQRQMMNRQGQGFGGEQMMPQIRMEKRMQMMHEDQPAVPDTTTVK